MQAHLPSTFSPSSSSSTASSAHRRQNHDHGHQGLLPQHSDGKVQIHATAASRHAEGCHRALQAHRHCNAGRIHLLQDPEGKSRLTTGQDHFPAINQKTPQRAWLLTEDNHTRPVEAQHPPHQLLCCRQRFRGKIRGGGERTTPVRHSAKILQMLMRLER
jgi:hypothetical protein